MIKNVSVGMDIKCQGTNVWKSHLHLQVQDMEILVIIKKHALNLVLMLLLMMNVFVGMDIKSQEINVFL